MPPGAMWVCTMRTRWSSSNRSWWAGAATSASSESGQGQAFATVGAESWLMRTVVVSHRVLVKRAFRPPRLPSVAQLRYGADVVNLRVHIGDYRDGIFLR